METLRLCTTDRYDNANQFNVVHPAAPTQCDAIRINVHPDGTAVGIIEVQVTFELGLLIPDFKSLIMRFIFALLTMGIVAAGYANSIQI